MISVLSLSSRTAGVMAAVLAFGTFHLTTVAQGIWGSGGLAVLRILRSVFVFFFHVQFIVNTEYQPPGPCIPRETCKLEDT